VVLLGEAAAPAGKDPAPLEPSRQDLQGL